MLQQLTETTIGDQLTEAPTGEQLIETTNGEQLIETTIGDHFTEAPIRIKLRKSQNIVTFDKLKIGNIDFNYHVNRCLQQNVFNALKKNTIHRVEKPRKLDTVANLTPEQLERKRASRRENYYNHKEQFNAYVKQRYNIDPVYRGKKVKPSIG